MTNQINNTVVGKPLVTGGVLVGPIGTPLPTDALSAPNPAFTATGYVTDNGVTKSEKRNTAVLYAWGGDTIAVTQKGYDVSVKVDLAEFLNQLVQGLIYGPANVVFTAAAPAPPVLTKGATAGTGGTFTAGLTYWVVTAVTAAGETVASNEVSTTLTATSTQVLNWTEAAGTATVTNYKVYRGTAAGAENVLVTTVAAGTLTYTDTGTAGTSATPPASGTAGTAGNKLAVKATSAPTPRNSWIFEVFSNTAKIRVVIPIGKVMDIGDTVFSDAVLAAYPVTLQAFPDASGGYFYVYTDDGQHD